MGSAPSSEPSSRLNGSTASFALVVLFLAVFSIANYFASRWYVGAAAPDRTLVYIALGIVMVLQAIYLILSRPLGVHSSIIGLMSLFALWVFVVNILRQTDAWLTLVQLALLIWWIITFTYFARLSHANAKMQRQIPFAMAFFFVGYSVGVYFSQRFLTETFGTTIAVTNVAEFVVVLAPFVLLLQRNLVRLPLIAVWVVVSLASFKRGVVIATAVMLFAYVVTDAICRGVRPSRLLALIASPFVLAAAVLTANGLSGGYLFERFSSNSLAEGSGRREIYGTVFQQIEMGSLADWLVGRGGGAAVALVGTGAHNDALYGVLCFGIIGAILMAAVLTAIAAQTWRLVAARNAMAPAAAAAVAGTLVFSAVSGFFFTFTSFFTFALFGYIQGRWVAAHDGDSRPGGAGAPPRPQSSPRPQRFREPRSRQRYGSGVMGRQAARPLARLRGSGADRGWIACGGPARSPSPERGDLVLAFIRDRPATCG